MPLSLFFTSDHLFFCGITTCGEDGVKRNRTGLDCPERQQQRRTACRRAQRVRYILFSPLSSPLLITLLLFGYLFSVEYNNRRDRTRRDQCGCGGNAGSGGEGGGVCTHSVVFWFFLYSPFSIFCLFIFYNNLQNDNRWARTGWGGTGPTLVAKATQDRTEGQAGEKGGLEA